MYSIIYSGQWCVCKYRIKRLFRDHDEKPQRNGPKPSRGKIKKRKKLKPLTHYQWNKHPNSDSLVGKLQDKEEKTVTNWVNLHSLFWDSLTVHGILAPAFQSILYPVEIKGDEIPYFQFLVLTVWWGWDVKESGEHTEDPCGYSGAQRYKVDCTWENCGEVAFGWESQEVHEMVAIVQ